MDNELNELNELKRAWRQLGDTCRGRMDDGRTFRPEGMRSRTRYLLRVYMILFVICLIYVPLGSVIFYSVGLPVKLCVATAVYFGLMAVCCYDLYNEIKSFDVSRMTLMESLSKVEGIESKRRRYRVIGIAICIPLIVAMFYFFRVDTAMLIGGITGAVLGGVIGIVNDIKIRRTLREIRRELVQSAAMAE